MSLGDEPRCKMTPCNIRNQDCGEGSLIPGPRLYSQSFQNAWLPMSLRWFSYFRFITRKEATGPESIQSNSNSWGYWFSVPHFLEREKISNPESIRFNSNSGPCITVSGVSFCNRSSVIFRFLCQCFSTFSICFGCVRCSLIPVTNCWSFWEFYVISEQAYSISLKTSRHSLSPWQLHSLSGHRTSESLTLFPSCVRDLARKLSLMITITVAGLHKNLVLAINVICKKLSPSKFATLWSQFHFHNSPLLFISFGNHQEARFPHHCYACRRSGRLMARQFFFLFVVPS